MTTSDALIVGEDFISEHYFSTDAKSQSFQAKVLERRKEWDAAKEAGHPTPSTRYGEERGALAKDFNGLSENADEDVLDPLYARLRALLGLRLDRPVGRPPPRGFGDCGRSSHRHTVHVTSPARRRLSSSRPGAVSPLRTYSRKTRRHFCARSTPRMAKSNRSQSYCHSCSSLTTARSSRS